MLGPTDLLASPTHHFQRERGEGEGARAGRAALARHVMPRQSTPSP